MKTTLIATVTLSHDRLLNCMRQTVPTKGRLVVKPAQQLAKNGAYYDEGFNLSVQDKVKNWIAIAEDTHEPYFVAIDADVQFLTPDALDRLTELFLDSDKDIMFQSEVHPNEICTGFFFFKPTTFVVAAFRQVLRVMQQWQVGEWAPVGVNINEFWEQGDQGAMRYVLEEQEPDRIAFFPQDLVWSRRSDWNPGEPTGVPANALIHHANWLVGVDKKLAQMVTVRAELGLPPFKLNP